MFNPRQIEVLVVDDDEKDIYLLLHAFRQCEVDHVVSVTSGEKAAAYISALAPYEDRRTPDLIFIDIKMHRVGGLDFVRWMQRNPLYQNIPVIVLSGSSHPEAEVLGAGARAFYKKPVASEELQHIVQEVLQKFGSH